MFDLELEPAQEQQTVFVQEEPALEIALPQVFVQPTLTATQRGKIPNVEALAAQVLRRSQEIPGGSLGQDYQLLVTEFQPLFTWAVASWDYLLSTEGCRFIPRSSEHRYGARGDYRAVNDKDFSRLIHGIFRTCVLEFAQNPQVPLLNQWLREWFWPLIVEAYRQLENPSDPRQRALTPYSYLRCVPYQFLNDFHHELVANTLQKLPSRECQAIDAYFLHFYTEPASAEALACSIDECLGLLRRGLLKLLLNSRLVYCLLRQIERY